MIHTATLVHDDVIDVAKTRRGRPSTNVRLGKSHSVLAGDWLYMQAFQMALRERNFHILDVLISLTQMMVEGELLQFERLAASRSPKPTTWNWWTAKQRACFRPAPGWARLRPGAMTLPEAKLGEFAWNLGMAFQLVDDMLDFTSREKILGKPAGNDLREGKVTLPLIYALERASLRS